MRAASLITVLIGCASATPPSNSQIDSPPGTSDAPTIDAPVTPDANTCATQPCDILSQCGCGTQACDLDFTDLMGTACRMITTPGHETATCNASNQACDHGFVCLGSNAGRACKKYCATNADCVAPRGQCVIDITGAGGIIPGIPSVCSSGCDPINVAAGGCPATWKCGIFTVTHNAVTSNIADCNPIAGTGVQGGNCKVGATGDDKLCAADFLCTTFNAGTNFNCRHACNKTANTGCVGGTTCFSFTPALTIGAVEYGVCN